MRRTQDNEFDSLRVEGGLFPGEFLNDLRGQKLKGQANTDYGLHRTLKLRDEIGRFWRMARSDWENFQELMQREDLPRTREAVQRFLVPMLATVFGFDLSATRPIRIGEREFTISHLAFGGADAPHVPLMLTGPDFELDKSDPAFGEEGRRRSPQGLMQQYLNATDDALWGVICNGRYLRILRDNPSMTRPAFVEVDLTRLFEGELYADFVALWVLLHASRFAPQDQLVERCWLEQWREQAAEQGERALKELRYGVEQALRELGNGFIGHPDNQFLREALSNGELTDQVFFQELLRLVYRFLFLLTAEDRNILHLPEADKGTRELYAGGYSLGLLRDRARKRRFYDQHGDLWQGLTVTFGALQQGETALGLPALGGLFAADQCPNLDRAVLSNKRLLAAVRAISWVQKKTGPTRINYRDMDTEELGSVYESLLELMPRINPAVSPWHFGFVGDDSEAANQGHARKTSGSYYTPDSLVQELIKSALVPVMEQRLEENANNPREALLSIKVCDPACGSGHFLLAAARKLAARLAELDAAGDQYTEQDFRHTLREVVQHCIYGVDLNPLAVELCKTALWIEALEPGKPLGFLDAHIRCGNALVGVFDPAVLDNGIPDGAFKPLTGDDKTIAGDAKKRNKAARKKLAVSLRMPTSMVQRVEAMPEDTVNQVAEKRAAWVVAQSSEEAQKARLLEDLYTTAFFVPKDAEHKDCIPTNAALIAAHQGQVSTELADKARELAHEHRFFHWRLAFPQVFDRTEAGFDVILGNPPWDVSQLTEKEFFSARGSYIADLKGAKRKAAIGSLKENDPILFSEYVEAARAIEAANETIRSSGQYRLTAKGKLNLYSLFSELFYKAISSRGRAGIISPTGIVTDDSNKFFFQEVIQERKIVSFLGFDNQKKIFPNVHPDTPFCLMTMGVSEGDPLFCFYSLKLADIHDEKRKFKLSRDDIALINPNTYTCPVFRSKKDAELTKKLYRAAPVLVREADAGKDEENPWGVTFSQGLFNMTSASDLFRTWPDLEQDGAELNGNIAEIEGRRYLPLYEAKMVHHYDHRWATYERDGETSRDMTLAEKQDPNAVPLPRYWVEEWEVVLRTTDAPNAVLKPWRKRDEAAVVTALKQWVFGAAKVLDHPHFGKLSDALQNEGEAASGDDLFAEDLFADAENLHAESALTKGKITVFVDAVINGDEAEILEEGRRVLRDRCPAHLLGWRDITNATNERTVISGAIPLSGVGNSFPLMLFPANVLDNARAALHANLTSLVLDFVARHKVGGTHLNFFIFKQLPVLAPNEYSDEDLKYISERVAELTYTSHDMSDFAAGLGCSGDPFEFNPERRHQLKCELDAYYAHLYDLTRDELRYILDPADVMGEDYPSETFRGLKNKEIKEFGEYRTQRLVLEAYDQLARQRFAAEPEEPIVPVPLREVAPGGWASPPPESPEVRAMQILASVLYTWNERVSASQAQLAAVLVEKPRLVTAQLSGDQNQWLHAVGEEAEQINQHGLSTLPRPDYAWGRAFREMVARGWLIEEQDTWRLGESVPPELFVEWALGRAGIVKTLVENRGEELGDDLQDEIREVWSGVAA